MRQAMLLALLSLGLAGPAGAATIIATRPGVMCEGADALAQLTLPDGSSRSAGARARPQDLAAKRDGGCLDIPHGLQLSVVTARRNTSIVMYDPQDGRGTRAFLVPNIDFAPAIAGSVAPQPSKVPAWPDRDYPPLVATNRLLEAVRRTCPHQGWDEHVLSHTEAGPWDRVNDALTPAQRTRIGVEVGNQCSAGLSCGADITLGMEVQMGHLHELVRAICSEMSPPGY